jgi:hypothetical protein
MLITATAKVILPREIHEVLQADGPPWASKKGTKVPTQMMPTPHPLKANPRGSPLLFEENHPTIRETRGT